MNTDAIESMVRDVVECMNSLQGDAPAAAPAAGGDPLAQSQRLPAGEQTPEWVKAAAIKRWTTLRWKRAEQ